MSKTTVAPAITDADAPEVDGIAQAEAMQKIEDAAAVKIAATFVDDGDVFNRSRIIAGAASRGASLEAIAAKVTELRVRARFPRHTEEQVASVLADDKGLRKLKLTVSKSSMQQYASTWNATVDAGVKPTKETIAAMFRVKSTGGHAKPLAAAIEALGDIEGEERASALVDALQDVLDGLRSAKKESEGKVKIGEDDGPAEDEGVEYGAGSLAQITVDGLVGVLEHAAVAMLDWSNADRDRAEEAVSNFLAQLLGEATVEVDEDALTAA